MSPERAAGTTGDGRSDIFSFGPMLYDMLDAPRSWHLRLLRFVMRAWTVSFLPQSDGQPVRVVWQ
jgi:hypothetical protein